jgi:hypothetical protein
MIYGKMIPKIDDIDHMMVINYNLKHFAQENEVNLSSKSDDMYYDRFKYNSDESKKIILKLVEEILDNPKYTERQLVSIMYVMNDGTKKYRNYWTKESSLDDSNKEIDILLNNFYEFESKRFSKELFIYDLEFQKSNRPTSVTIIDSVTKKEYVITDYIGFSEKFVKYNANYYKFDRALLELIASDLHYIPKEYHYKITFSLDNEIDITYYCNDQYSNRVVEFVDDYLESNDY